MKLYNLRVVSPLSLMKGNVAEQLKKKGKSKNKPDSAYDAEQLKMGTEVEMEHGLGKDAAKEIAKDHLEEMADYYTKLKEMEAKKSLPDLEKGKKVPVGTVSGKYKKVAEGKWVRIPKGTRKEGLSSSEKKTGGEKRGIPRLAHEATVEGVSQSIKVAVGFSMPKLRKYQALQDTQAKMVYENKTLSEDRKAELLDRIQMVRDVYTAAISVKNFNDDAATWADNIVERAKQSKQEWEDYKQKYPLKKGFSDLEKGEKEVKEAMKHPDKTGAGAKKRKKLKSKKDKVHTVMSEFKRGTLHSSSGEKVTSREQAIAIAMSESGQSKKSIEEYLDALEKAKGGAAKDMTTKDYAKVKGAKKKNLKAQAQQREKARFNRQQRKEAGYDVSAEKSGKVGLVLTKGRKPFPVGTIAVYAGQKYQKTGNGIWKPVSAGAPKSRGPGAVKGAVSSTSGDTDIDAPVPSREKGKVPEQGEFPTKAELHEQQNTKIRHTKLFQNVVSRLGQFGIANREKHAVKVIRLAAKKKIAVSQAIDDYIKNTSDKELY